MTATPVHSQATRRVALQFDDKGQPYYESVCSPESFKQRALCLHVPVHVIPVIFVPGTMGSNLRPRAESDGSSSAAWRPPNGILEGLTEYRLRADQSPGERQAQLSANAVEVDDTGSIALPDDFYMLTRAEGRRRGWGEVHWDSYGKLLVELEKALNEQYLDCGTAHARLMPVWKLAQELGGDTLKRWNPVKGDCNPLDAAAIGRLEDYYFPVWAVGYNWLDSNANSASRLLQRIDEILAYYRQSRYFVPEGRVLLITHSMGGLVAREAARREPDKILGVVHGVQPAAGAPVVYRRLRAGTEGGCIFDLKANMTARVLGWSAADVTCVMANAPGALELLPTRHYPPGWLKVEVETEEGERTLFELPESDPYAEIYAVKAQDRWWGMVDETLIDPARSWGKASGRAGNLGNTIKKLPFEHYLDMLKKAKDFHTSLGLACHPYTYAHYGADEDERSFVSVRWRARPSLFRRLPDALGRTGTEELKALRLAQAGHWTALGEATVEVAGKDVVFALARQDGAGDGTVPEPSGRAIEATCPVVFRMAGFDHQGSYAHEHVLNNVLYCAARIVQQARTPEQIGTRKGPPPCAPANPSSEPSSAARSPVAASSAVL